MNKEGDVMAVFPLKMSESKEAIWTEAEQEKQRGMAAAAQKRMVWQIAAAALCAALAVLASYIAS